MFFILNSRMNLQRLGAGARVVAAHLVLPNIASRAGVARSFIQTTFNRQFFAAPSAFPDFEAGHSLHAYRLQYLYAYTNPIRWR